MSGRCLGSPLRTRLGHVDDGTAFSLVRFGNGVLWAQKRALGVDVQLGVPHLSSGVLHRIPSAGAGVVEQNVQPADEEMF